jgi:hypothetical protein
VVRRVEGDTAALDFGLVGGGALKVDGHAVKVCGGTEGRCVLTRIEGGPCWIAVGVDYVAMIRVRMVVMSSTSPS